MFHKHSTPARSGNALAVAIGVLTLVAAGIAISATSAVVSGQRTQIQRNQMETLSAVEAVMAKHEIEVISRAEAGDPVEFAKWQDNYGLDLIGNVEVRWKIEPVRSAPRDASGTQMAFITNPSPDIGWEAPASGIKDPTGTAMTAQDGSGAYYWNTNDSVYLFRLSAEGRYMAGASNDSGDNDWSKPGVGLGRSQGARYIAVNKEPLFRYVIFYAQTGPKGDLEFSHGPAISIQGNVHSNGAIYMGADTSINSWGGVRPTNFDTQLGPDPWVTAKTYSADDRVTYNGKSYQSLAAHTSAGASEPGVGASWATRWLEIKDARIRVTGVDGLFRLAKPAMYGRFNAYPMTAPSGWTAPSAAVGDTDYNRGITTPLAALESSFGVNTAGTFADAILSGAFVNPYRLKLASALVTRPNGTPSGTLAAFDYLRRINGTPIFTGWTTADAGNDARDDERTDPSRKWSAVSTSLTDGFAGYARTRITGGRVKKLPDTLQDPKTKVARPMEAQVLSYPDPALLTGVRRQAYLERGDDHTQAAPVFQRATSAETTTDYSIIATDTTIIEQPGEYVRKALGSDSYYLARRMESGQGFIGWKATDKTGTAIGTASSTAPVAAGIIIRERPVPASAPAGMTGSQPYIPYDGTIPSQALPDRLPSGLDYTPYAYGKHKDLAPWPFLEFYVGNTATRVSGQSGSEPLTTDPMPTGIGDNTAASSSQQYLIDTVNPGRITVTAANAVGTSGTGMTRQSSRDDGRGFFRDNARLIHFKRKNVVDERKPAVDMTMADTYFSGATFKSVQLMVMPQASGQLLSGGVLPNNYTGSYGLGRQAGLMIRPLPASGTGISASTDLGSTGKSVNSRLPVAALLVSPERGISVQRRLAASTPSSVTVGATYYNATAEASPAIYGTASTGLALLNQHSWQDTVAPTYSATVTSSGTPVRNPTTVGTYNRNATVDSHPTINVTLTKNTGETVTSQTFTLGVGPYTRTCTLTASKSLTVTKSRARLATPAAQSGWVKAQLNGPDVGWITSATAAPSVTTYAGKAITIYSGAYGGATLANYGSRNISAVESDTVVRFDYPQNNPGSLTSSGTATPTSVTSPTLTQTDGKTASHVYIGENGWAAAVTFMGSQAALTAAIGRTAVTLTKPAWPTTWAGASEPATPATPTVADPATTVAKSAVYQIGSTALPFRVPRDAAGTRWMETNSWISARGTWFATQQRAYINLPSSNSNTAQYENFLPKSSGSLINDYLNGLATPAPTPPLTNSFRPDYWTGSTVPAWTGVAATDWGNRLSRNNAAGSIVGNTLGTTEASAIYTPSNGIQSPVWEDAQVPVWRSTAASYRAADGASSPKIRASVVLAPDSGGLMQYYYCKVSHTSSAATAPAIDTTNWAKANIWLRLEQSTGMPKTLTFKWYGGDEAPPAADAASRTWWQWRTVNSAINRRTDDMPYEPSEDPNATKNVASDVVVPTVAPWSDNHWLLGACVQSGSTGSPVTADFGSIVVTDDTVHDSTLWEGALAGAIKPTVRYLCSQYQVFWGPFEITEDFFNWTVGSTGLDSDRTALEQWFNNTREFWSQSRWWNEGDLQPGTNTPVARTSWVEKETGLVLAGAPAYPNGGLPGQRELFARTTVLDVNLGNLQNYLRNRTLADATRTPVSAPLAGPLVNSTDTLATRFTGLLYVARTNRYPRNPTPTGLNPWNPQLPNQHATGDTTLTDFESRSGSGTSGNMPTTTLHRLFPVDTAGAKPPLAPPIRWEDFHHGVMISNGNTINWGHNGALPKFGSSKMSIVTPNQLYIRGSLNDQKILVDVKGDSIQKWTPIAVMGDSVTLLSNSWTFANYKRGGLTIADRGVDASRWSTTGNTYSTFSKLYGFGASDTAFRTCILTNNQPTTKYRVFQGEGAPFINTMQFMEDWGGADKALSTDDNTMSFTGSLVVLDSCRYTRSFLLQYPRTYGRSPFGLMGWHREGTWNTLTGNGATTIVPDWCKSGSAELSDTASPSSGPTDPNGTPPIYCPPKRNMTFNLDLLTEEGTPPYTPFGVTAAGVAGWGRVIR